MSDLDANDLVFNNNNDEGIHTGGFGVNSILMKKGLVPIISVKKDNKKGGSSQVSDLFGDLVIPNWTLAYDSVNQIGGKIFNAYNSDEDDILDEDLHDKLIGLVSYKKKHLHSKKNRKSTKKGTKKNY
jgi:hypothetical protein